MLPLWHRLNGYMNKLAENTNFIDAAKIDFSNDTAEAKDAQEEAKKLQGFYFYSFFIL